MKHEASKKAALYLQQRFPRTPRIGLILGSGLGVLAEEIENPVKVQYSDIPGFPATTVEGHAGQLVFGSLKGVAVVVMQGRFHYYEGYDMQTVTFPVRVMKELGVEILIVTNAAGGINTSFSPGDLMIISDHINCMGGNPLVGSNYAGWGVRFPDMSEAYDRDFQRIAKEAAIRLDIPVQEGVYIAVTGPSYETPAEIRMFRTLGADAVGMSTVPEVIVARHSGLKVLGISCISNMAAGILGTPLHHDEVIETTERVKVHFLSLVKEVIRTL